MIMQQRESGRGSFVHLFLLSKEKVFLNVLTTEVTKFKGELCFANPPLGHIHLFLTKLVKK